MTTIAYRTAGSLHGPKLLRPFCRTASSIDLRQFPANLEEWAAQVIEPPRRTRELLCSKRFTNRDGASSKTTAAFS
jgi:hypothetical protein